MLFSGEITISICLQPMEKNSCPDVSRVTKTDVAEMVKKTLCIARKISRIDTLEILQDYSNASLKASMVTGEDIASDLKHPESLAIKFRIQTDECQFRM